VAKQNARVKNDISKTHYGRRKGEIANQKLSCYLFIYLFTINKDWRRKSLCLKVELVPRPVEKCLDSYEKGSVHSDRHC